MTDGERAVMLGQIDEVMIRVDGLEAQMAQVMARLDRLAADLAKLASDVVKLALANAPTKRRQM